MSIETRSSGRPLALINNDGNISILSADCYSACVRPYEDIKKHTKIIIGTSVGDIYQAVMRHPYDYISTEAEMFATEALGVWGIEPVVVSFSEFDQLLSNTRGKETNLFVSNRSENSL
jgi:hypothetical protein